MWVDIFSIKGSKFISDLKGDTACIYARTLRERGEEVRILNIGNQYTDILGETSYYNPLCLIVDAFQTPGGLLDISDDVDELSHVLYAEPTGLTGGSDNGYFRTESRALIAFAVQMVVLIHGHNANMGHVSSMLRDKNSLHDHAKWVCGKLERSNNGALHS